MSEQIICTSCRNNIVDEFFCIVSLILITDCNTRCLDIKELLQNLDAYAFLNGYHLSGSQIVLLRPDILYDYLDKNYRNEVIQRWYLREKVVCLECYDTYKTTVPVK